MEKMHILLVDDEERFLATTKKLLLKKGYDAVTALSGQEALEKLAGQKIDIVILDVKMPGMDGIATLKAIKGRYPLIEVIMLTGHATVDSAIEGLKAGATDYMIKPTHIEELLQKAQEAFEKRQRVEEKIQTAQAHLTGQTPKEIIEKA